ncbi:MAG: ROK family protein [Actinomycetes bacterium]
MRAPQAIGIDLGGTKILAVRASATGEVFATARRDTPRGSADQLVGVLVELVRTLREEGVGAVGIGLPGMVNAETGALTYAPGLGFPAAPLRALVQGQVDLPVVTDNDANVAAWAEYRLGAGIGVDNLALVTLGTGLGCGMIVDGCIFRGRHGHAAEVSHLILDPGGPPCECGKVGCWGVVATGANISRLGRAAALAAPTSAIAVLQAAGLAAGESVTAAAERGDPSAMAILRYVGDMLGRGLASLANLLDPSMMIVGGGPSAAGELLLDPTRASFARWFYAAERRPSVPVVIARFDVTAGAIGAAVLAMDSAGLSGRTPRERRR